MIAERFCHPFGEIKEVTSMCPGDKSRSLALSDLATLAYAHGKVAMLSGIM